MKKITPRLTSIILGTCILFSVTVPAFALTWVDQSPGTAAVDIYYDFRPSILGQPNSIAPWQVNSTMAAMQLWSSVSNLNFIWNPWAPDSQIINIGVSPIDGQWSILGQGGYNYTNAGGFWHIAGGIVDMDLHENWDSVIGNGNPGGTIDFFTVATHEIGHALGLDHSGNSWDQMYPYYNGEKTWLSSTDVANIQALYGGNGGKSNGGTFSALEAVPEPATIILLTLGLLILIAMRLALPLSPRWRST